MYKIFGYYICEKMKAPDWLGLDREIMISVSDCFGGIHPDLTKCYFLNDRIREQIEYKKKWKLGKDRAAILQRDIGNIFESRLAIDGRFLRLADAEYFYGEYFNQGSCMIVSVSTSEEYYDILTCDLAENSSSINNFFSNLVDQNELLGYDILGWDISGFHTFLCNNLQKDLIHARFNHLCLLENPFREVDGFAKEIQGKGEPVEWIPCRIGKCQEVFI